MGSRKGATLMPTLRSAWSGETLGQTNASQETHRVLEPHSYRLSLVVGFQAEYAAGIIGDSAGGTPQRFVFASANDAHVPRKPPQWPGEIRIKLPPYITTGQTIDVDADVTDEIQHRNWLAVTGQESPDPLDSHRDLVTLKVAALLGAIDGRFSVNATDWQLAKMVVESSDTVRRSAMDVARWKARDEEARRTASMVRREAALEDESTRRALISGAKSIARKVHKSSDKTVDRTVVKDAPAGKHKKLVSVDEMVGYAESEGWIVAVDGGWIAGEVRPV